MYPAESCLPQEVDRLGAAATHLAVDDNLAAGIELTDAFRQVTQRDQMSPDVADLVFVGLTYIEYVNI